MGKPKPGSREAHVRAARQEEADRHEAGERAAKGLRNENSRPYGLNVAGHAIARRTGADGLGDVEGRKRY